MKKKICCKIIALLLAVVFTVNVSVDCVYATEAVAAINALGIVGDILGIVVDGFENASMKSCVNALNNKIENHIEVTDEELGSVLKSLQNLQYNGTGALMSSCHGVAWSSYYASGLDLSAVAGSDSYFCWYKGSLICVSLKHATYSGTATNSSGGVNKIFSSDFSYSSVSTSYGTLSYVTVGYYGARVYSVTSVKNTPIGEFQSYTEIAKAIHALEYPPVYHSTVQQNYELGDTGLKISGSLNYNGKTLADYNYNWEEFITAQGITIYSVNQDTGDTINNTNITNIDNGGDDSGGNDSGGNDSGGNEVETTSTDVVDGTGNGGILDSLKNILNAILNLPKQLSEAFVDLLKSLFVPSEGYFDDKIQVLKAKFAFINSVSETADVFLNFLQSDDFSEPPVLVLSFSSSGSRIFAGLDDMYIDFSWYAPLKPKVDFLLSSMMWVMFSWRTFKSLPNIINGNSRVDD